METVIVKQEEEDWTYKFDGTEADPDLEIKTELDQDVDLQGACESTVPTLFNISHTIKQEPTDSFEEAVTSQENSTLCMSPHYVCDTTIVKVEDRITDAVKENDVWLQRLARAQGKQEESLQHEVKEECHEVEGTPVAKNTPLRKRSIPVIVGSRKFVLVPRSTRNALAAATNTHEEQKRPSIAKLIMKVLEDKNSKIKPNLSYSIAQPPVAENDTILKVLRISNKPVSKVFSTVEPCLQPKHIQPPQNTESNIVKQYRSIPDCIFQPKIKNKTSDITETSLKRAMNNVVQRSMTINRILDNSVSKTFMTPLIMTKKIKPLNTTVNNTSPLVKSSCTTPPLVRSSYNDSPLVRSSCNTSPLVRSSCNSPLVRSSCNTSPLVRSSCNTSPLVRSNYSNSSVVSKDSTQAKEPRLPKQSKKLLNILETLKASKRAEAFKKVPCVQAATNHRKSPVANVKPMPQKTIKSNPTSVKTKIREILTYINSRLPQPIEAKATLKPIRLKNSIPTSQLEAILMPCYVKLDRLKLLTCAVCREQFYLKSQFVQHVFKHVRTPNVPCNICGKYYQRRYIKIHERREHGPKKFWCDHCGKKCSDKGSLINHLIIHSDTKLYRCDVCKKRFRRKSNLLSHLQMHSTDKPYSCIICDKQFRRKTSLSKHSLYHLAVRPHQCKICDKQFCHLFHLERHFLIHTGERPFACEICNMRFTRSSHRNRHMAKHMSAQIYACEVCEKPFKERSRLEKHKRVHEVIW